MRHALFLPALALLLAFVASPALAQSPLKALEDCRGVAGAEAKAACYDTAAQALSRAVETGEIVIVQKREAQAAQRSAFGLSLPAFTIFDRKGPSGTPQPLDALEGEVQRAYRDANDKWVVVLTDGAVWRQTDNETISRAPKQGSKVEVRRASFGSYFMRVDGQRGVRASRGQ